MKSFVYDCSYPIAKFYWFLFRPNTYGTKVVIEREGKILMVRHSYGTKRWSFPGGGKKGKETPEEIARREILEEIGCECVSLKFIGEFLTEREYKHDHVSVFVGTIAQEPLIDYDEIIEYTWVFPSEANTFTPLGELIFGLYQKYKAHGG